MAYKNSFDAEKAALGLNPYDQKVNPLLWKRSQSIVNQINEMKLVMKIQSDPKSWYTSLRQKKANPLFILDGEQTFEDVYHEYQTWLISEECARDLTYEAMARQDREFDRLCKKYKKVRQKDIDRLAEKLQQERQDSNLIMPPLKSAALFDDEDLEYQRIVIPEPYPDIDKPVEEDILSPKKTVCINPGLQRKIDIIGMYLPGMDCHPYYRPRIPDKYRSGEPVTLNPTNALLHEALTGTKRNLPFLLLSDKSNICEVGPMMYWLVVLVGLDSWYKTGKRPDELFKHLSTGGTIPQVVLGSGLEQVLTETHAMINPVIPSDADTI